jgi:hypothetical protein
MTENTNETININEIYESALKDPTLFSTIDIEQLLDSIESSKNDYLENKTMNDVTIDIFNKINELYLSEEKTREFCNKLIGYRYVDEIHEIHKGKHIRWLRNNTDRLTNGGIVVDVKFMDNGTQILCMNSQKRFMQYKFDDCLTFQKLSVEEQLILMAYEYIDKTE